MTTQPESLPDQQIHDDEDDYWGVSSEESREEWAEYSGRTLPLYSEKTPPETDDSIELPEPQEITTDERESHSRWKSRIKRLGSFMLGRREQNSGSDGDDFDAGEVTDSNAVRHALYEEPVQNIVPKEKPSEGKDYWAMPDEAKEDDADLILAAAPTKAEPQEQTKELSVAELFEQQGFVKEAPYLRDQVNDTSRTNIVRYDTSQLRRVSHAESEAGASEDTVRAITEHEGLVDLKAFLDNAGEQGLHVGRKDLSEAARIIADKLSFIGNKELGEAAEGIKSMWQDFLEENPDNVLHVVAGVSSSRGVRKSDQHVAEQILCAFSDEELEAYAGRIKLGVKNVNSAPDKTKIVLVDDWTISGSQIEAAAAETLFDDPKLDAYRSGFEVNMVAASEKWLESGLQNIHSRRGLFEMPIKAYFKTHDFAPRSASARFLFKEISEKTGPVTGTHSSGDFGFENVIHDIVDEQKNRGIPAEMPPLTNIVRDYPRQRSPIYLQNGAVHKV